MLSIICAMIHCYYVSPQLLQSMSMMLIIPSIIISTPCSLLQKGISLHFDGVCM